MAKCASFREYAVVACGTLNMELNHLKDTGFLDASKILYTKPGRYEVPRELESQLIRQISNAKRVIIINHVRLLKLLLQS